MKLPNSISGKNKLRIQKNIFIGLLFHLYWNICKFTDTLSTTNQISFSIY